MRSATVPGFDFRLLLRAGVPSAVVLIGLVAVLLWRVADLEQASAREDRADQAVVQAATLSADFIRLQNDERTALLLNARTNAERPKLLFRVDRHFGELYRLLTEPAQLAEVRLIHQTYHLWLGGSERRLAGTGSNTVRHFSAATLQLNLSNELLQKAGLLVQELRGSRMRASHMNEDAARSAVLISIAGMVALLVVLTASVLWSLGESQREAQLRWEIERDNERAREVARVKSEFVTHMSHELRTPLTAIIGLTEMLHDEKAGKVTPLQKRHFNDILNSGQHLLALINSVLDVAIAEAGKIEFHPQRCNPSALALEVVQAMYPLAAQKRIAISLEVEDAPAAVETDPSRFRQILYNYLSNAVKFAPEGSGVRARIMRETGARFRLEVLDSGPGIEATEIDRLFVDFSQLDGRYATARGAGLGLALTKRIVEMQGGNVGVRSVPGSGSAFFAVLPDRSEFSALMHPSAGLRPYTRPRAQ